MLKMQAMGMGVLLVALGCGGPLGPFPGGRLSGESGSDTFSSWSSLSAIETAQLETRPQDPYSVSTWFANVGANLYVPTSMILGTTDPQERAWVSHVERDPRVRIRIGERVYARKAVRVNGAEFAAARAALESKYELDPAERDPERTVWIYRLDAR